MWKRSAGICGVMAVVAALGFQFKETKALREELAAVRLKLDQGATPAPVVVRETRAPLRPVAAARDDLPGRIVALEEAVAQLTRASDYLMERGQLPLAGNKLDELRSKLADATASDRDRMQALRLLRRNRGMTDDVVQLTLDWLRTSTNSNLREDLVQQFDGLTNAIVRAPLLQLAGTDADPDVREEAVDALRRFGADPEVEALLWNLARNDPDGGVREEAQEALADGPLTESKIAAFRQKALDPQSTLDERLLAMRALRRAPEAAPDVIAALAEMAQTTQDSVERAQLFRAFDGARDPNLKLPLVYGLQDPNPVVREEAVDALSSFNSDPAIAEWLRYVAENDADPRVRREAFSALEEGQRRRR